MGDVSRAEPFGDTSRARAGRSTGEPSPTEEPSAKVAFPDLGGGLSSSHGPDDMTRLADLSDVAFVSDPIDEVGLSMALSTSFALTLRTRGKAAEVRPFIGQFGLLAPGHPTEIVMRGECLVLQLRLPLHLLRSWWSEDAEVDGDRIEISSANSVIDPLIAGHLCAARRVGPENAEADLRAIAKQLLVLAGERPRKTEKAHGGLTPSQLRRVNEFIDANLCERVTLASLASEARLSPFHFSREFKRSTGRAPYEYVIERRIAKAMTLLRNPKSSVSAIARESGFTNESRLSRCLKKSLRHSPTQIQRSVFNSMPSRRFRV